MIPKEGVRGGSWYSPSTILRAAFRGWYVPGYRDGLIGFRLARSIPALQPTVRGTVPGYVVPGGAWTHSQLDLRNDPRYGVVPGTEAGWIGFRLVKKGAS